MHDKPERPKKVKVTVIDNETEKLPDKIDMEKDIHHRQDVAATKETSATTEPDWKDKYLRLAAELDNNKKRLAQSYEQQLKQEKERLLLDFLEVADNLERALRHSKANPEALVDGVKTIQRQFQQTLAKHEVRPFQAKGQHFDPEWHEAVSVIQQTDLPPNTVAQVAQTGYTKGESVLRPARVIVTADR